MNNIIIQLVAEAIAVFVTAGAYYLWSKYIKPWLEQNRLIQAAEVAVRAA